MANRGRVKWFSNTKGYGFIEQENGDDAFVHYSDILDDAEYKTLEEGEEVTYEITDSDRGPKAVNVARASNQADQPLA